MIFKKIKLISMIIFPVFILLFLNAANVNEIHLTLLENMNVNNKNGTITLYFRAEKATLVNPETSPKSVYRVSPNSDSKGYYQIEPLTTLSLKQIEVKERPAASGNDKNFVLITESESSLILTKEIKKFKMYTILLFDVSGSITAIKNLNNETGLDKIKSASVEFIDTMKLDQSRLLSIYAFDGKENLIPVSDFSNDKVSIKNKVLAIDKSIMTDRSTNLYGAIINALDILNEKYNEAVSDNSLFISSLIIFTDGKDMAGRLGTNGFLKVVEKLDNISSKRNINVFTIGLGKEIEPDKLKRIGIKGYTRIENYQQVSSTLKNIAKEIEDMTNCYYKLEYQTPSRKGSGEKTLLITVKDGIHVGGIRKKFDTALFEF